MKKKEKENKTCEFKLRLTPKTREDLEFLALVKRESMSKIVNDYIENEASRVRESLGFD